MVLMETDTDEEEEEECRAWIDDSDDAWALIRPTGRRPFWWNIRQDLSSGTPVGATAGQGVI